MCHMSCCRVFVAPIETDWLRKGKKRKDGHVLEKGCVCVCVCVCVCETPGDLFDTNIFCLSLPGRD